MNLVSPCACGGQLYERMDELGGSADVRGPWFTALICWVSIFTCWSPPSFVGSQRSSLLAYMPSLPSVYMQEDKRQASAVLRGLGSHPSPLLLSRNLALSLSRSLALSLSPLPLPRFLSLPLPRFLSLPLPRFSVTGCYSYPLLAFFIFIALRTHCRRTSCGRRRCCGAWASPPSSSAPRPLL
jgi:hypothetical protein